QCFGLIILTLVAKECCELAKGIGHVYTLFSETLLANRQCALKEPLGLIVSSLITIEYCQRMQAVSDKHIVQSHLLPNAKRTQKKRLGQIVLSLEIVENAEVL